ncbi:hypothetical protein CC2G_000163 [Coprinopsis cinerea AmutBmut pab1-1]|nr:hypothetical protein CC2G_000163 [Coprinopsis cinerea AmutBmut pab1-1]
MSSTTMNPESRLEELQMIRYSLLPEETFEFVHDPEFWEEVLNDADVETVSETDAERFASAIFTLRITGVDNVWLQVTLPVGSRGAPIVSVKSDTLPRTELESWQRLVNEKVEEARETEFGLYNILSSQLLPLLHEFEPDEPKPSEKDAPRHDKPAAQPKIYHVLFTSHHLISPKKRRSLQQWSSSLRLSGFAKVGYPGLIYAQGDQENLEEFVYNVKAMQWLALKVRFVEPLPERYLVDGEPQLGGWREFQRVGEVVEEMKKLKREDFIFDMGIGSSNTD